MQAVRVVKPNWQTGQRGGKGGATGIKPVAFFPHKFAQIFGTKTVPHKFAQRTELHELHGPSLPVDADCPCLY